MSLKIILNKYIESKNGLVVSLQEIEAICKREGRKVSNGERRLRASESPKIGHVTNSKGAIVGYYYKPSILGITQVNVPMGMLASEFLKKFPSKVKVEVKTNQLF